VAHLHFKRTVYKSGGSKAKARVEYMTRGEAKDLHADRQLRYIGRGDREDLVYTQSRNLPAWADGNALTYFRAAEQYERANGNAFEEWKITLPQELRLRQNMDLMRDLVAVIAGDRLPITYAFHCPATMDGTQAQPHLHLLISGRQADGIARTPDQHFKRYNRVHPERGGAQKDPALRHLHAVKQWRVTIADVINVHLERAGIDECLHPDRLEDRAIARQPEPKLLPSQSQQYREHGTVSETMQAVLTIRAEREQTRAHERANARGYWEERKDVLGLTATMDLPTQLAIVGAARALVRDHAPVHTAWEGDAGVEQDAQRLLDVGNEAADDAWRDAVLLWAEEQGARALRDVGWEAVQDAREAGHEALQAAWQERWQRLTQAPAWTSLEHDLQALARQLDALREEEGGTGRVRVRLWDRAQGLGL
jgi:hypothetical protein